MQDQSIQQAVDSFLKTLESKSAKTKDSYRDGLDAMLVFYEGYYESDYDYVVIDDIDPADINFILSYFVIRKFFGGLQFRIDTAKAIKHFVKHLADNGLYDKVKANDIIKSADYYKRQYPRIFKLEKILYRETEGRINDVMSMTSPKAQKAALEKLKQENQGSTQKEAGYVQIEKISGGMVYGHIVDNPADSIGPVKLSDECLELVNKGDIINMITISKRQGKDYWEVAEVGYVYPLPYDEALSE